MKKSQGKKLNISYVQKDQVMYQLFLLILKKPKSIKLEFKRDIIEMCRSSWQLENPDGY